MADVLDDERIVMFSLLGIYPGYPVFREIPMDRNTQVKPFFVVDSNGITKIAPNVYDADVTVYVHNADIKTLREIASDLMFSLPEELNLQPTVFQPTVEEFYKSEDPVDGSDRYTLNLSFTICTTQH